MKRGQHSFLTPFRLEKLNEAGFVWSVRSSLDNEEVMAAASSAVKEPKTETAEGEPASEMV